MKLTANQITNILIGQEQDLQNQEQNLNTYHEGTMRE